MIAVPMHRWRKAQHRDACATRGQLLPRLSDARKARNGHILVPLQGLPRRWEGAGFQKVTPSGRSEPARAAPSASIARLSFSAAGRVVREVWINAVWITPSAAGPLRCASFQGLPANRDVHPAPAAANGRSSGIGTSQAEPPYVPHLLAPERPRNRQTL